MINSKKLAAFFLFFTLMGSTAVFAQNTQLPQQQQQKIEVADEELLKFAKAFQAVTIVSQQAQQEMVQKVQDEGFEIQRFNEIHQAALDPNSETEATVQEKENYEKVISQLEPLQVSAQENMEKAVKDAGISLDRYEQIVMSLQADPELQQRLKQVLQG